MRPQTHVTSSRGSNAKKLLKCQENRETRLTVKVAANRNELPRYGYYNTDLYFIFKHTSEGT